MADTTTTSSTTSPVPPPPSTTNNILVAYEASAQYLEAQETLGMQLKKAFLLLARARMRLGAGGMMGSDFCREDLGASRRVKANKVVTVIASENGGNDDEDEDDDDDPPPTRLEDLVLIIAGGLAPPELREAQQGFIQALESVMMLATAAQAILKTQQG